MGNKSDTNDTYIPTPKMIDEEGLLVGWSLEHEKKGIGFLKDEQGTSRPDYLSPILHKGPGHLMTIASTGAGKGVGCIIPALLRHKGPVVVIDPKGENYAVTARARREMGQQVVLLDPYEVTGDHTDGMNPLDMVLNFEGGEIEQCKMLAEMIILPNALTNDVFWDKRAEQLISGLLLYLASSSPPALQNLTELRYLLNQSRKDLEFTVKDMARSNIAEVKTVAHALAGTEPKVLASILSTAQAHTDFLAGNQVSSAIARTTFDIEDVILGKPLSIYLVIPPDKLDTSAQLIRMWIGMLFNLILMRNHAPEYRTLFILDEAAQMGRMELLTKAITLLRGYGLQTWSFWQDLSQLSSLYPNWETLYNNCRVHQNFGITNARFAKQVSQLTDYPNHREILKLDNDEILLQVAGDEAVIAQRPNYLSDLLFEGQADPNPFHSKDDDNDILPQHAQRRYKRRKNRKFSSQSEVEELRLQLKEALNVAKEAAKEAQEANRKLEKLSMVEGIENNDDRAKGHTELKVKPEESEEPWGPI